MRILCSLLILTCLTSVGLAAEPPAASGAFSVSTGANPVSTAPATVTLTAATGNQTLYLCGFSITSQMSSGQPNNVFNATVSGLKPQSGSTTTLNFLLYFPTYLNGVGVVAPPFAACMPAASGQNIVIQVPAIPANGSVTINAVGYVQ
jgi:hypothetical protein